MCVVKYIRKLYYHLNGCPLAYVILTFFVINTICAAHPCLTIYAMYVYTFRCIQNRYATAREKRKRNIAEYNEVDLQVKILKNKMMIAEAEFQDRAEVLPQITERLRNLRTRVFEIIAADDGLRNLLHTACNQDITSNIPLQPVNPQKSIDILSSYNINKKLTSELMKSLFLKSDMISDPSPDTFDFGKYLETENGKSNLNEIDGLKDCKIKIVKVTNVYKVAYLKHFIKQKRTRRANKRAILKEKMESIRNLLENWQKSLNMVTQNKFSLLNGDQSSLEVASQEAMVDFPKACELSDSDSDIRNDLFYDDCRGKYYENPLCRDYSGKNLEMMYPTYAPASFDAKSHKCYPSSMLSIVEETGSQMAIEDIDEHDDEEDDDDDDDDECGND